MITRRAVGEPIVYTPPCSRLGLHPRRSRWCGWSADPAPPTPLTLPLGIPWIGAHFRVDALSAFFLCVVNLGGAGASLYGLGYGRHETQPQRVLPFFPAFLAGMNLVLVADDAFTFLWGWEFDVARFLGAGRCP